MDKKAKRENSKSKRFFLFIHKDKIEDNRIEYNITIQKGINNKRLSTMALPNGNSALLRRLKFRLAAP